MKHKLHLKLLFTILLIPSIYAGTLLQCLAKEEDYYAKLKYTGPNYKLNQIMIEQITSLGNLSLNKEYDRKICKNASFPSLRLLEQLLLKEKGLFDFDPENKLQEITFEALLDKSGNIFISYLTSLQATYSIPGCLEKKIPEVAVLLERYLYLETSVDRETLDGPRSFITSLFEKLSDKDILKDCTKPQ